MRGFESPLLRQLVASVISLATSFFLSGQNSSCAHSAVPRFQPRPAALGSRLGAAAARRFCPFVLGSAAKGRLHSSAFECSGSAKPPLRQGFRLRRKRLYGANVPRPFAGFFTNFEFAREGPPPELGAGLFCFFAGVTPSASGSATAPAAGGSGTARPGSTARRTWPATRPPGRSGEPAGRRR